MALQNASGGIRMVSYRSGRNERIMILRGHSARIRATGRNKGFPGGSFFFDACAMRCGNAIAEVSIRGGVG